jgi:DNA-binding MarR family transcriptional regulator
MFDLAAIENLDRVIHERGRLAIMSLLAGTESLSFKELKEHLRMTDGNHCVHMRTLEESGYVSVRKSFVNRKPRTEYTLTPEGRRAFQEYIDTLAEIVQQSQQVEQQQASPAAGPTREVRPVLQQG